MLVSSNDRQIQSPLKESKGPVSVSLLAFSNTAYQTLRLILPRIPKWLYLYNKNEISNMNRI